MGTTSILELPMLSHLDVPRHTKSRGTHVADCIRSSQQQQQQKYRSMEYWPKVSIRNRDTVFLACNTPRGALTGGASVDVKRSRDVAPC
jgi:hypothetical protein